MTSYGGQCDHDCSVTATGWPVPATADEYLTGRERVAACPAAWIGRWVDVGAYGRWHCLDTFGNPHYRAGAFYHHAHGWGVAIDLLWPSGHATLAPDAWRVIGFAELAGEIIYDN